MGLPHLLLGLIEVIAFRFLLTFLIRHRFSSLWNVPGPFLARYTDWWYFWRLRQGQFEEDNLTLHKQYGPVVRYGSRRYNINDPASSKIIYGLGKTSPKSSWYSTWVAPGEISLFSDQDVNLHLHHRRLFQNTYSLTAVSFYEQYVNDCVDIFCQRLSELSQPGLPINMGHWFQCYAFDVIGLITYGERLGFLDHGKDVGSVIHALEDFMSYAAPMGIFSSLHRLIFPLRNYFTGSRGSGRAYVISFTQDRITEHTAKLKAIGSKSDATTTVPFLIKFLKRSQESPRTFTSTHVTMGCTANMVAGSDTAAITLSAILYHLLKNPKCLRTLQQEIDQFYEEGKLSDKPTFQESQKMPYLQAVIKEALRIHPASGLPLERVVPKGGAMISGYFFPEDTVVGINIWVEHRNQSIYGPEADIFKPERWLTQDDQLSVMNRHWMPFGLGSRTCLGRHISMLEISKLIPRIIRDFNFELGAELEPIGARWNTFNYWFVKPKDFYVKVTSRN
ncbi:cytochrome P450 [Dactylonectria estremocensis]|uniref:Cytochrome P450 n=1 Tax=Dactylonectria estremocensis TaxID=1079267 RepID=A0A9P9JD00_9HYPO|nr:cytochrome P450 [Dactylonectria estremocensis]